MFLSAEFHFVIRGYSVTVTFTKDDRKKWRVVADSPGQPFRMIWDAPKSGTRPRRTPAMSRALACAKEAVAEWEKEST